MMPPIQRLAPGVLLLTGDAVDALAYVVAVAQRVRRHNGLPDSRALAALAAAATGQPDSDDPHGDDPRDPTTTEWITTKEAAQMLECSDRQTRRLAPGLGGRLTGGRWLIDRHAVTEHLEGRRA